MTIKEALFGAKNELKKAKVSEPEGSADFLMREVLKITKSDLYANLDRELAKKEEKQFKGWIKRRLKHEPVWQITGAVDFFGRNFKVNKNVLVPRPETEMLIQEALKKVKPGDAILDVGTGSGTIIVTLAAELGPKNQYFASDIFIKALSIAKKNAKENGVYKLIKFKKSDLLRGWKGQKFDIICANLPYIPHEEMDTLAFDVMHYEPRVALDGGKSGIEIYDEFFAQLPEHLNKDGTVFCEIGHDQGTEIKRMVNNYLPQAKTTVLKDLADIDRIVTISNK